MATTYKAGSAPVEPPALPEVTHFEIWQGVRGCFVGVLLAGADVRETMLRPDRDQAARLVDRLAAGDFRLTLRSEAGDLRGVVIAPDTAASLRAALMARLAAQVPA
jgi:hypothetical protein